MNRKLIIGIFCLSCIVFGTGALMTVFIDNVSCDEGYTLKDKKCYKYDYVPYLSSSCKDGYVFNPGLNEGICVKYQKYSIFDKYDGCGYSNDDSVDVSYKDGKCHIRTISKANKTNTCEKNYTLNSNNLCYKETTIDATLEDNQYYVCPIGYEINGNKCHRTDYKDPEKTLSCLSDEQELIDDFCYSKEIVDEIQACPSGEVLIDDKCYALTEEYSAPSHICPYGYNQKGDECVKEFVKEPIKKH